MQTVTDSELLKRFAGNADEAAFEELVRRHGGFVRGVCRRLLGSATDVDDACQATFLALSMKAGQLHDGSLVGWLHRVAHNAALQIIRSATSRRQREEAYMKDDTPLPESEPDNASVLKALECELAGLRGNYREAVILRYLEGNSQETAAELAGCTVTNLGVRASRGIAKLRAGLAKRGVVLGAPALIGLLDTSAKMQLPEPFISSITAAVKMAATSAAGTAETGGKAMMLAKSVLKTMFWAKVKMAALVVAGVAVLGGGAVVVATTLAGGETTAAGAPAPAFVDPAPVSASPIGSEVFVTPHGCDGCSAFDDLERKGGPKVLMMGVNPSLVPVEMRFQPVGGRQFIEAIATSHNLKVGWVHGGKSAVLYPGVSESEVERLRKDLESVEVTVRREAAWRAGWLWDVRVVPLLVNAAKDADGATARQAVISLRRANWAAVVVLDETAVNLLAAELDSQEVSVRCGAVTALGHAGGAKVLALLEKALSDKDDGVRGFAAETLWHVGGDKATVLLEKALSDNDHVYQNAISSLSRMGGRKALAIIEKEIANTNRIRRCSAIQALGNVGGEEALAHIGKALEEKDALVRISSVWALGRVGGDNALALLERALSDKDAYVRSSVPWALSCIGGDKALALIETALADTDFNVRRKAAYALGNVGGDKALALIDKALDDSDALVRRSAGDALSRAGEEKALPLIKKALSDKDAYVRSSVPGALSCIGGDKALALIESALSDTDVNVRRQATYALGNMGGESALALLEKTLANKDSKMRSHAVTALNRVSGERALTLLEKPLSDQDVQVRSNVISVLGSVGGEQAQALLLKRLKIEKERNVLIAIVDTLKQRFSGSGVTAEALNDFKMPGAPELQPHQVHPQQKVEQEVLE